MIIKKPDSPWFVVLEKIMESIHAVNSLLEDAGLTKKKPKAKDQDMMDSESDTTE